ncbi:MAG: hypothetical protein GX589_03380 [Deltaproteobacteria bacterium]|nr:hypothetical protein [Deltaproteobacteria bacterium]
MPRLPEQVKRLFKKCPSVTSLLCGSLCFWYIYLFWKNLSPFWFNPKWTTDDAFQQSFPFHAVHHPHIFEGDLLYNAMKGYLPPLHYGLGYLLTWLVGDPVMMGHWLMLIQIVLAALFMFLGVRALAGWAPAFLAVTWLLHTRHTMQRLTGGLQRGWALPLLAAFVYFLLKKNHTAIFILLLLGCLLHPPATVTCGLGYGLFLCWGAITPSTRSKCRRILCLLIALVPLYAAVLFFTTRRPAYMGDVVNYTQAEKMPEFTNPGGRFPFVPLADPWEEFKIFGFQPFFQPIYQPGIWWQGEYLRFTWWRDGLGIAIVAVFVLLLLAGLYRRRQTIPCRLLWMFPAILITYFAARLFAFKLFVPDRYLQYPLTIFWISAFSIGIWRLFYRLPLSAAANDRYQDSRLARAWPALAAYLILAIVIVIGSGKGLSRHTNFNRVIDQNGEVFRWIKKRTPENAYFAGHPNYVDGLPLFGMRRTFATTETTHPFFPVYLKEMMRRLEISLRAHYAKDLKELVTLLKPEGVDYFVFSNLKFSTEALKKEKYFKPLDSLVRELTSRPSTDYAFRQLPPELDPVNHPYMLFKDAYSVVINVNKLEEHLIKHGGFN